MNEVKAYDKFNEQIKELTEICNFLPDVSNEEGYKKSKRVSLDVGKILTAVEGKRKDLKAESLAYGRQIDAEANVLKRELMDIQHPHKEAYKELDNAKKEREAKRKAKLEKRIADIRDLPEAMRDSCADEVQMAYKELMANECDDFYECSMEALKVRQASLKDLSHMYGCKLIEEEDAAELARLKKEAAIREEADKAQALREQAEKDARSVVEEELEGMKEELEASEQRVLMAQEQIDKTGDSDEAWKDHVASRRIQAKTIALQGAAFQEHKRKINDKAILAICAQASLSHLTQYDARAVITAIAKGSIPHLTINYEGEV